MKTAQETLRESGRIFEHEEYIVSRMEKHAEEYAKAFAQFVTDRYDPAKSENDILSDIEVSNYMDEFKEFLKK